MTPWQKQPVLLAGLFLSFAFSVSAVTLTAGLTIANLTESDETAEPTQEQTADDPASPSEGTEGASEPEAESTENASSGGQQEGSSAESDGTSDASDRLSTVEGRPHRLRQEERDALREEHEAARELGREVERLRETLEDEDIPIEYLREMAIEKIERAAKNIDVHGPGAGGTMVICHVPPENPENAHTIDIDEHAWAAHEEHGDTEGPCPGGDDRVDEEAGHAPVKVCFDLNGDVTSNRDECDPDQGNHFGATRMREFDDEDFSTHMEARFSAEVSIPQMGPDLLGIIGGALQQLSGSLEWLQQENPEGARKVQEVIAWLGSILSRYGSDPPSREEGTRLAMDVRDRLEALMEETYGYEDEDYFHDFDCSEIVEKVGKMTELLVWIIQQFEDAGIPVPQEARDAADRARALYEEIRQEIEGNPNACERLEEVFGPLEGEMRPVMMEAAMGWAMGAETSEERLRRMHVLQELMVTIESRMSEVMGGMTGGMGPPSGMGPPMMPPGLTGPADPMGQPRGMSVEQMIEMKREWIEKMSDGDHEDFEMPKMDEGEFDYPKHPGGFKGMPMMPDMMMPEGMEFPDGMTPDEFMRMKQEMMREYEGDWPEEMEFPDGMSPEDFRQMERDMVHE